MQLFKGRYVAIMCLFFILSFFIPSPYKLVAIVGLGIASALIVLLFFIFKRKKQVLKTFNDEDLLENLLWRNAKNLYGF